MDDEGLREAEAEGRDRGEEDGRGNDDGRPDEPAAGRGGHETRAPEPHCKTGARRSRSGERRKRDDREGNEDLLHPWTSWADNTAHALGLRTSVVVVVTVPPPLEAMSEAVIVDDDESRSGLIVVARIVVGCRRLVHYRRRAGNRGEDREPRKPDREREVGVRRGWPAERQRTEHGAPQNRFRDQLLRHFPTSSPASTPGPQGGSARGRGREGVRKSAPSWRRQRARAQPPAPDMSRSRAAAVPPRPPGSCPGCSLRGGRRSLAPWLARRRLAAADRPLARPERRRTPLRRRSRGSSREAGAGPRRRAKPDARRR